MDVLIVGSIDEISAGFIECVKELEGGLLVHGAHTELGPLVADAHAPEAERGDMDGGARGELAIVAKLGGRLRGGSVEGHGDGMGWERVVIESRQVRD